MKLQHVVLGLLSLLLIAACQAGSGAPTPPEIHYGEDICANCGMIINDARFATAYAYAESEGRFASLAFDDIGDMIVHIQKHPEHKRLATWVHDFASEAWIDADAAFFVLSDQIKTPMNHGVAAFADKAAADKMAEEIGGKVLDWDHTRIEHLMEHHH